MGTAYVVQEVGYEYNDEYYYRPENQGGIPKFVFTEEKKAQEKIIELVASEVIADQKSWRNGDMIGAEPFMYACDYDGPEFSQEQFDQFCDVIAEMVGGENFQRGNYEELWDWRLPAGLSLEQRQILAKMLTEMGVVFYEIVEVESEN